MHMFLNELDTVVSGFQLKGEEADVISELRFASLLSLSCSKKSKVFICNDGHDEE